MTARVFEDKEAKREATQVLVGLIGASGTGKTFSALRLATGIQRVTGGEIYFIDTEARRALHYAEKFKFRHLPFGAPFDPLSYLAAIEHCVARGAKTIVIDSMSHEHEGPGGVLEWHEAEVDRLVKPKGPFANAMAAQMPAWAKPKAARRRLINTFMQIQCNFIFCFRAKEKIKIIKGKDPEQEGWQPLAGDEFVYEMMMRCILKPGADGCPTWKSELPAEQECMKLPEQFRHIFPGGRVQLSEDIGQALAEWSAGVVPKAKVTPAELISRYSAARTVEDLKALEVERQAIWGLATKDEKLALKSASGAADAAVSTNHPSNTTTAQETSST
jgi:ABC-type oligopeptide transport system ATPase subunit